MNFRKIRAFTLVVLFVSLPVSPRARAAEPASGVTFWGGGAAASTRHEEKSDPGMSVVAGIALPLAPADRQSIRFSVSRLFDQSSIARYNLLCHFGYRVTERFGAGLLGGAEYMDVKGSPESYLKPLIGAEVDFILARTASTVFSLFTAYESAQGSTGTIALNGGSNAQTANILSLGLIVSFAALP